MLIQVASMTDAQKEKIRNLTQDQVPIQTRRALYNQLGRRVDNPYGLKPGLLGCSYSLKSFA